MNRFDYGSLAGLCGAALVGLVILAGGSWLSDVGPGLGDLADSMQQQDRRRARLNRCSDEIRRCIDGKAKVIDELQAGRLTLLQAAASFRELQDAVEEYNWYEFYRLYQGSTDEERFCRAVIFFAQEEENVSTPFVRQLEAALQVHLQEGSLRFPTPR